MHKLPILDNNVIEEDIYNPEDDFNVKVDENNNQYIDNQPSLNPSMIFKNKPKTKSKKNKKELKDNLQKEEYLIKDEKHVDPQIQEGAEKQIETQKPVKSNKVTCDICGSIIAKGGLAKHKKSKKCMSYAMNGEIIPKTKNNSQLNIPNQKVIKHSPLPNPIENIEPMNLDDRDNFNQFLRHYQKLKDIEEKKQKEEKERHTLVEQIIERKQTRKKREELKRKILNEPLQVEEPKKQLPVVTTNNILQPKIHNPYAYCFSS